MSEMVIFMVEMINQWGIFGLFPVAVMGSTVFVPFAVEFFFPALLAAGLNPYLMVIVAALGSTLGTFVNYWVGRAGLKYLEGRVDKGRIERSKKLMDRYGWVGLLFVITVPLPIPVDGVTIIPGITKMNFMRFSAVILLGKIIKYSFFVGLLNRLLLLV